MSRFSQPFFPGFVSAQISVEHLQDHWSSGLKFVLLYEGIYFKDFRANSN